MTKEEIQEKLPQISFYFTELDYEVLNVQSELVEELETVNVGVFEHHAKRARSLKVPSNVLFWHFRTTLSGVTPVALHNLLYPDAPVSSEEELKDISSESTSLGGIIAYFDPSGVQLDGRCSFVCAGIVAVFMSWHSKDKFDTEEPPAVTAKRCNLFLEALTRAKHSKGFHLGLAKVQACERIVLLFIARVFADLKACKYPMWRAVYRALHDYGLTIAYDAEMFVRFMHAHEAEWVHVAKSFGVDEKIFGTTWNNYERSPLSNSGNCKGGKPYRYYNETPWCEWKEAITIANEADTREKREEELRKLLDFDSHWMMCDIARELTQWLDMLVPEPLAE